MSETAFRLMLYLPAQGAAETEATIVEWYVEEGQEFHKGQVLGQIDSAKSVFNFEAPCDGRVVRILHKGGETVAYDEPVLEIETSDPAMRDWIPPAVAGAATAAAESQAEPEQTPSATGTTAVLALGGYLPQQVVTNEQLAANFEGITPEYIYQVTGIRQRRWASEGEKPSDMAYRAALEAIGRAGLSVQDIDAVILATSTPDVAMPATACILQQKLGLKNVPAFDLNAACSGWIYAVGVARGLIAAGTASCVLTVGVDLQSRLLDRNDPATRFLFGDGAGAAIVAQSETGHRIHDVILSANPEGLRLARRFTPGYFLMDGRTDVDPWIRVEGQPLFRMAVEGFAQAIQQTLQRTGWPADSVHWVVPHQANARILKAAAKRCQIPFERFFLNIDSLGNTSSASIPLALLELEPQLMPGNRVVLCSVGAGLTTGAIALEW